MWHLSWQHLRRHWRLNLITLGTLTLAATMLASLPLLAVTLANQHLKQVIQDAPVSDVHLLVQSQTLPDSTAALLNDPLLESLVTDQIEIWEFNTAAVPLVLRQSDPEPIPDGVLDRLRVHARSFNTLEADTVLLNGRYPEPSLDPNVPIEVVLGQAAADTLLLNVGDGLLLADEAETELVIVGLVEPRDPLAHRWWGDQQLLPFGSWRLLDLQQDFLQITLGVLAHPQTMQHRFSSERSWRILLDHDQISAFNIMTIGQRMRATEVMLTSQGVALETGLVSIVERFEADLGQAQVSLLLLSSQAILAVAYTLLLVSGFMLEQSEHELLTLLGRGMSRWQVLQLFGGETAVLAFLLAWPLGVLLAWGGFAIVVGATVLPVNSWWLGLLGVSIGWLAVMLPLVRVTWQQPERWLRQQARADNGRLSTRTLVFDGILLFLGGLFYWQLRQTGQATSVESSELFGIVDPVLLLGPTVLLLAIALLFTRLFPLLLRLVAWFSRRSTGFLLPLSLTRLARDRVAPSRIVFLISLTTGLTLFALVYTQSVTVRQEEMAFYRSGADIRFVPPTDSTALPTMAPVWEAWDGVEASSEVFRGEVRSDLASVNINFMAVEPDRFTAVSGFPDDIDELSLDAIMAQLEPTQPNALPAILSNPNVISGLKVGDLIEVSLTTGDPLLLEVRGIIRDFPTLRAPFILTDLTRLRQQAPPLDSTRLLFGGAHERWLAVDDAQHTAVVDQINTLSLEVERTTVQIVGDRQALLDSFRADLISQQLLGAFRLNAWVLVLLSAASFLTIQLYSARSRLPSLSVLNALGVSARQIGRLLLFEGGAIVALGLLIGVGIGAGMAQIMSPFLTLTLSSSIGGVLNAPLIFNWLLLGQILLLLTVSYLLILFIFGRGYSQEEMLRTMRTAED